MKYIILIAFIMLGSLTEEIYTTGRARIEEQEQQLRVANHTINLLETKYTLPETYLFTMPVSTDDYHKISSYFGYRNDPLRANSGSINMKNHPALDLTGVEGARVQSIGSGIVESKWYPKGRHNGRWYKGNDYFNGYVQIRMDNGFLASYGHVYDIIVHEGDRVTPGQDIARIDPNPNPMSTGPHVHFSLQDEDDNFLQPQNYIDFRK